MNHSPIIRKIITLEFLAYLVVLVIAAALRFSSLGALPLTDHEASLGLQALRLSRGEQIMLSGEPGYIALTTFLFYLFEPTDFTARFWPALSMMWRKTPATMWRSSIPWPGSGPPFCSPTPPVCWP